jgi:hypothetical protein
MKIGRPCGALANEAALGRDKSSYYSLEKTRSWLPELAAGLDYAAT